MYINRYTRSTYYVFTSYLPLSVHSESTLTLTNLCNALAEVKDWDHLSVWLNVPDSKRLLIKRQHRDPAEAKEEMLKVFLAQHPAPSWATVTEALYRSGYFDEKCHHVLQEVRRLYGTGTHSGCHK